MFYIPNLTTTNRTEAAQGVGDMEQAEIKNAKITSVRFGKEDHGIMTCYVMLDYGGSGQGFGGYAFDRWDATLNRRVGAAYGMEWMMRLFKVLEVQELQELIGMPVRVESTYTKIHRIGHFIKDQWFDPSDIKTA